MKRTHGYGGKEKLYSVWSNMRNRCNNPKCKDYKYYGAKGVKVCNEWDDYAVFRQWSYENGYIEGVGLSIDRIKVNVGYEPGNCRWTTRKIQANNMSRHHYLTINGATHNLAEWSEIVGLPYKVVESRLRYGWEPSKAISTPLNAHRKLYEHNNETHTLTEWAQIVGVSKSTLYSRVNLYGWSFEDAISTDVKAGGHYK